jgi:N-acetylneuraminic acid mutarotase
MQPVRVPLLRKRPKPAVTVQRLSLVLLAIGTLLIAYAAPAVAQGTWTATSTTGAPTPIFGYSGYPAVWTGSKMFVWGPFNGCGHSSGRIYDPAADTWTATSTTGAPYMQEWHSAVWTGSKMIVWGGDDCSSALNTGGTYNPATDSWTATSTTGAPTARKRHTAVWTGSKMIIWGGLERDSWSNPGYLSTGGIYDPATDSWTAMSTTGAPAARVNHKAVWTGSRMIVWGGKDGGGYPENGGIYDPTTDTWTAMSTTGAPTARMLHTAVWTGSKMIVWGGTGSAGEFSTGGIYDPAADTWTATSTTGAPRYRDSHTAVWTGSRMIIWGGGVTVNYEALNTGGIYDPATDTWTATSTTGAPGQRYWHTAVWTGSRMIIWGGYNGTNNGNYLYTGGIYDPGIPSGLHPLYVWKDGTGGGTVTSSPAGIDCGTTCSADYVSGTSVTLTVSAASGSTFAGWSGDCSGTGSCTVVMNADRSVTATFTLPSPGDIQLSNGVAYPDSITGALPFDAWKYYYIDLPAGATSLTVVLDNLTANADLRVRFGIKPDLTTWDCSPWLSGTTTETCSLASPAAGRWWIGVNNVDFDTTIGYRVTATFVIPPTAFYTVPPCRVADTRNAPGPLGGPALAANTSRSFPVAGVCGIPSTAVAVAINMTVVDETDGGDLRLYPAGSSAPSSSSINFGVAKVRANNASIPLGVGGQIAVQCDMPLGSTGKTQFLFDVTGYFQ